MPRHRMYYIVLSIKNQIVRRIYRYIQCFGFVVTKHSYHINDGSDMYHVPKILVYNRVTRVNHLIVTMCKYMQKFGQNLKKNLVEFALKILLFSRFWVYLKIQFQVPNLLLYFPDPDILNEHQSPKNKCRIK